MSGAGNWTDPGKITRAEVLLMSGEKLVIDVDHVICNTEAAPLWLTYTDHDKEVIVPWTSISRLIVLDRRD